MELLPLGLRISLLHRAMIRYAAVSFYNSSLNSPYEIYVYKDLTNAANPSSGTLAATKTGTLADSGYFTIPLPTPVSVTSGNRFSVVIKLTTPNLNFPIPGEWAAAGYSSGASASPGKALLAVLAHRGLMPLRQIPP